MDCPPLRIVRFSGKVLAEGIDERSVDGVNVKVSSVARTVVDCFKFRNKIGLVVALEAVREAWDSKRIGMDELWRFFSPSFRLKLLAPSPFKLFAFNFKFLNCGLMCYLTIL